MTPFTLYDEADFISTNSTSPDIENDNRMLISIDIGKDRTLHQLIEPIRVQLIDKSDKLDVILYLVCGKKCSQDLNLFVNYLLSLEHNISIFLRGYIHPEIFGLLLEKKVKVDNNCRLIYSRNKLHELLVILMKKQEILRKFLQRFVDEYHKFPQETLLDLTELSLIGIEIEKF